MDHPHNEGRRTAQMGRSAPGLVENELGRTRRGPLSKAWFDWKGGSGTKLERKVLAVRCMVKRGFFEPMAAEGLKFGKKMGLSHLVLEGDSKLVEYGHPYLYD